MNQRLIFGMVSRPLKVLNFSRKPKRAEQIEDEFKHNGQHNFPFYLPKVYRETSIRGGQKHRQSTSSKFPTRQV